MPVALDLCLKLCYNKPAGTPANAATTTVGWIGDYMGAITATGNELLLVFFAMPLVGLGIGALKRLAS